MGYREQQISDHAIHIIDSYSGRQGLKLFYKIKGVKIQNFKEHAPSYYQWLLGAVPSGYQAEVNKKVQELRSDLKTIAHSIITELLPRQEDTVPLIDKQGPTLFADPNEELRKQVEAEELLEDAAQHEFELLHGRKPGDEVVIAKKKRFADEGEC